MLVSVPLTGAMGLVPRGLLRHLYAFVTGALLIYIIWGVSAFMVFMPVLLTWAACKTGRYTDGWMDGWMDVWMDGWMDSI